jgi:hypothetical protein
VSNCLVFTYGGYLFSEINVKSLGSSIIKLLGKLKFGVKEIRFGFATSPLKSLAVPMDFLLSLERKLTVD